MSLKKAFMYDSYHNKIRHTYINPDDPEAISWVISSKKYQTLLNLTINEKRFLVIGDNKSRSINGIMVKYNNQNYLLKGSILFLCVSSDLMSVNDAEVELNDISKLCKIINSHD